MVGSWQAAGPPPVVSSPSLGGQHCLVPAIRCNRRAVRSHYIWSWLRHLLDCRLRRLLVLRSILADRSDLGSRFIRYDRSQGSREDFCCDRSIACKRQNHRRTANRANGRCGEHNRNVRAMRRRGHHVSPCGIGRSHLALHAAPASRLETSPCRSSSPLGSTDPQRQATQRTRLTICLRPG